LDIDNFRHFVVVGASMLPHFELDIVKVENERRFIFSTFWMFVIIWHMHCMWLY
jgi:hypothetical protein